MDSSCQGAVTEYSITSDASDNKIVNAKLSGGHEYRGPVSMDGSAQYCWNDGTSYTGDFQQGEMTGFGVYQFINATYNGHVYKGVRHGYGTLVLSETGAKYVGEWSHGKRHGKGVLYYKQTEDANGPCYDGEWVDGKREGYGLCKYENGDEYHGEWKNDTKNGKGVMRWRSLNEIYFGEWRNDKPHGHGLHVVCNHGQIDEIGLDELNGKHNFTSFHALNWYYGEWTDGKRDGFGVYHYSNGSQYKGEWKENQKHGAGEYVYENNAKFVGQFVHDQQKYDEENESAQQQRIQHDMNRNFVIDVEENLKQEEQRKMDMNLVEKVMLRHWEDIKTIFPMLCRLEKLWILIEDMKLRSDYNTVYDINERIFRCEDYKDIKCNITDSEHCFLFREFPMLCRLEKLWILIEDMKLRSDYNTVYDINERIFRCENYKDIKCDITDSEHCFLFREFPGILLRLSMFSKRSLEEFILNVIESSRQIKELSLNALLWNQLPAQYLQLWNNEDCKILFEEQCNLILAKRIQNQDIDEHKYASYIDGHLLQKHMQAIAGDAMIQTVVVTQFQQCYNHSNGGDVEQEPMAIFMPQSDDDQQDISAALNCRKFLMHECKLFYIVLISIKVSHDEHLSEKERLQREKEEAEQAENAKKKAKKSGKAKKSKKEAAEPIEEPTVLEETKPEQLKLVRISPQHLHEIFDLLSIADAHNVCVFVNAI
eukprot:CAMPEP_0197073144 /NCGR_PEP_ID=MMETSP1384-20130603/210453_1 /TAXON_ID=29189 /ORGANISM="Ammonia sp." /LENGTH=708 /DNA_ID=CAMNT_0042511975 /DNA_START=45 /DNA_END=2172 /DNA_ORIENTATION=-